MTRAALYWPPISPRIALSPQMDRLPLQGLRVLVVEDNFVLADSMRWALGALGCVVVGPVPNAERALQLIDEVAIDAAILDIDLQGKSSAPVAERLRRSGLPFVFLTGYDSAALLPAELHDARCLSKPVDPELLAAALLREVSGGPARA